MTPEQREAALRLAATLDSRMSADPEGDEEAAALLRELAAEPVQEATPADKAVYSAIAENYAAPQQRKPAQEPVDYIRLIRADFEQRKRAQGYSYTALTLLPSGAYLATDVQEAWEAEKRKYAAPQQRQPDKAAQDDAYYCGRRDEEQAWASRFANLSEMLKQSDERYMALLKNVADGMALRPPAPIIMQAQQQRQPLTDEQIDAIPFIVDFKAATLRDLAVELRRFARAVEKAITGEPT